MLTRFIRNQLIVFAALTVAALIALGWFYLRIPSQLGLGQYRLTAELPASGGLYRTANVTYRGIQIGKVIKVEPTAHGVEATLSIDDRYKIPIDASANVHSVSAIGEQYVDLVSTGDPGRFFAPGQTITKGTVPSEIGPALDAACRHSPNTRSRRCSTKQRLRWGDWGRRCNDLPTRHSPSSATSRPTCPTSTTSSTTPHRCWTAR